MIAGQGYESNRILEFILTQGPIAVIPPKSNRRDLWDYDREPYREPNLIERAFNKLKRWRRIATRYDRRSITSSQHSFWPPQSSGVSNCRFPLMVPQTFHRTPMAHSGGLDA